MPTLQCACGRAKIYGIDRTLQSANGGNGRLATFEPLSPWCTASALMPSNTGVLLLPREARSLGLSCRKGLATPWNWPIKARTHWTHNAPTGGQLKTILISAHVEDRRKCITQLINQRVRAHAQKGFLFRNAAAGAAAAKIKIAFSSFSPSKKENRGGYDGPFESLGQRSEVRTIKSD